MGHHRATLKGCQGVERVMRGVYLWHCRELMGFYNSVWHAIGRGAYELLQVSTVCGPWWNQKDWEFEPRLPSLAIKLPSVHQAFEDLLFELWRHGLATQKCEFQQVQRPHA